MATCDGVGSTSQDQESEECFTYECDACKQESQTEQATVYCPECEEHLCSSCESSHKKLKATRFHNVVPANETAGEEKSKSHGLSRTIKDGCACDTKRKTVCFCLDHQELICSMCKNAQHRKCQSATIEDMISKASISEKFDTLSDQSNSLLEYALQLKQDHVECLKRLTENQEEFENQIHKERIQMAQWVDKLEENTQLEMKCRVEAVTYVLKDQLGVITDTLQLLDEAKQCIERAKILKSERQMIVIIEKFLKYPIKLYEETLNEFKRNTKGCAVTFERNKETLDFQQRQDCFGYFDIQGPMANVVGRKVFLRAQAEQLETITLRTPHSEKDSRILAFACASNGEILIAGSNKSLLHLDADLNIKSSVETTVSKDSLAPLKEEVFVVLTDWGNKISYVAIAPTLHISRSVKLKKTCEALAAANQCIYLLTRSTSDYNSRLKLQVLDKLGNLIKTLDSSEMDMPLESVSYLALNPTGSKFFVTDAMMSTVTCMTTSGKSVYVYKDQQMKSPRGIVVDEDDNALVVCCCYWNDMNKNIHMIKSDGTRHKILISGKDGIRYSGCIGYRATDGLLFVGSNDKVLVFKMR